MAARIRKDDIVEVIAGNHKGARGKVLRILKDKDRVIVEGVNMVWRHMRKSQRLPQGGRIQKEAPIHISNVMPLNPRSDRPTRVRFPVKIDGSGRVVGKQRVALDGATISEVTRAQAAPGGRK